MKGLKFWYRRNLYKYVGERTFYLLAGTDNQTCFPVTDESLIDNLFLKMEENKED